MNRGRGSRDVLHTWLHFSLFNVANVLHCLYNLKKSNLKCVTSKNLVTTCKLVGYMVFSRYAIIRRPHIQPGYLFELGLVKSRSPWLCQVKGSEGQVNSDADTGIVVPR